MNYENLIVLVIVVALCLVSKIIAALIVARKEVTASKAKSICKMFEFNPLSILKK